MTDVIRVTGLKKSFGRHVVLKGIDLEVPQQSVFAFLGNNGAGKSTTIRILSGLLAADAGEAQILGMDVHRHAGQILKQIGALVEAPALYPNLTAAEFLGIACSLKQVRKNDIHRVLSLVELTEARNRRIRQFSLGMKQRLALAFSLIGQPKLLLLDEPTNGLDPQGMQDMRTLLRTLPAQTGCTIFVSSHLLDEVEKIASHVAVIVAGRVRSQISLQDLHQQLGSQLILHVGQPGTAMNILAGAGFIVQEADEQRLSLNAAVKTDTPRIVQLLVSRQVELFELRWQRPSLEDWFLLQQQALTKADCNGGDYAMA